MWYYSPEHRQAGRVIEKENLWGQEIWHVWFPGKDVLVRLPAARLRPISSDDAAGPTADWLVYVSAAARIANALTEDVLLAPIGASVIPLPHQLRALSKAVSDRAIRYLLADEVGLGKTIEAGLILRELKLRGLVRRTLVVAPKGLATQWIAEMQTHFNEEFHLLLPSDFAAFRRLTSTDNLWDAHDQVVTSMDAVKPMERRRGWSQKQIEEYNRERFENLISARWDLVIVDEAHRLGGSSDLVARHQLGKGLAEAAPYFLLLSATPHQGKSDAFYRLMSLLDEKAFPDEQSVTRARVQRYVIRTEKRQAIDADGRPLFKQRRTEMVSVSWKSHHAAQQQLYEAVTEYVRDGYNQALRQKERHIGFLMILMQRLVVSSTRAIRATLERRLEALEAPPQQLPLFPMLSDEDWADLDGQEQLETALGTRLKSLKNEREEVALLLEAAKECEQRGPDAKAEQLLEWIYRLQSEENDPELKILIFTEFVPTQQMLYEFLTERGFGVVLLNGSMSMEERQAVQESFAKSERILISTDAGGEGLNLQFCNVVINYDLPWNPMRLEQRIGRVDRIGQRRTVRAINFSLADSVESRVTEVLERKLAVILEEFGIDKTGDVLDSTQMGSVFDELYVSAIVAPGELETKVDAVAEQLQSHVRETRTQLSTLGQQDTLEPDAARRILAHPLPQWIERMTIGYLRSHGGSAEQRDGLWHLTWPDGETMPMVAFSVDDREKFPWARHVGLDIPRVRGLTANLPVYAPGQPISQVFVPSISARLAGFWSLWRISLSAGDWRRHRVVPVFIDDEDRVFRTSAQRVWDALVNEHIQVRGTWTGNNIDDLFHRIRRAAEEIGRAAYDELAAEHRHWLSREKEKAEFAFGARRRAIERVGLKQVRNHRLKLLDREVRQWRDEFEANANVLPEMTPLMLIRVEGNVDGQLA